MAQLDPEQDKDLWGAFPVGYFPVAGTSTISGVQVLRGKNAQCVWFWPETAEFSKPGLALFDQARPTAILMPDLSDASTWNAVLRFLAGRVGINGDKGVIWMPKAKEIVDRKRSSSGKGVIGWTLRNMVRSVWFPLPDIMNEETAILRAIAMTNCACGRGVQRDCPLHGENKARPWR